MGNQQNKVNRSLLDRERMRTDNDYDSFLGSVKNTLAGSNSNALRNQIQGLYSNPDDFLAKGSMPNASGWFDLPGSDSPLPSVGADYSAAKSGYQKFADTGGINRADFDEAKGSYSNFINTGGLGESDKAGLRARATSQIPSFYNSYKNELARRRNVQGGYSPGFDSSMAEIGRQSAREGFNASRQVEGDIIDRVQQGRMFGTQGSERLAGTINQMEQTGKLAGLGGLKGIGDSELSASQANASLAEARNARNLQAQLGLAENYAANKRAGAAGLSDLYRSAPGLEGLGWSTILSGLGGRSGNSLANLGMRNSIKDRSWLDYLNQAIGAGGGIAQAAFAGGKR